MLSLRTLSTAAIFNAADLRCSNPYPCTSYKGFMDDFAQKRAIEYLEPDLNVAKAMITILF